MGGKKDNARKLARNSNSKIERYLSHNSKSFAMSKLPFIHSIQHIREVLRFTIKEQALFGIVSMSHFMYMDYGVKLSRSFQGLTYS